MLDQMSSSTPVLQRVTMYNLACKKKLEKTRSLELEELRRKAAATAARGRPGLQRSGQSVLPV